MLRSFWKMLGRQALCTAALLASAALAQAQGGLAIPQPIMPTTVQDAPRSQPITPAATPAPAIGTPTAAAPVNTDDKARIDRLEKQVQELTNALKTQQARPAPVSAEAPQGLNANDVRAIINGYLTEQDAAKKTDEKAKADAGYKVGTDLRMNVTWKDGIRFETPNQDFYVNFGARMQYDVAWWGNQNANLLPVKQVGKLQDENYFRRIRLQISGGFWEIGEFNFEPAFENTSNGILGLDEVWAGVKDIPFLGTIRVGHQRVPQGLEGDQMSSSKVMTFLERASYTQAFFQNFATGIYETNAILDQRATWHTMFYRQQRNPNGDDFADGEYAGGGRLTGLAWYENQGRQLLHLGASAQFRAARRPIDAANGGQAVGVRGVAFAARPEVLDAVGGATGDPTQFGAAGQPGNKTNWVSTGLINCDASSVYAMEFLWIHGPFSLQGEYAWTVVNDGTVGGVAAGKSLVFDGGYIQASYFLTGENRQYDKRLGRLASHYIAKPHQPFWLVRDGDGNFNYGLGAWELAARWSHLDLNDGIVRGGMLDNLSLGVNWHLNNNLRVQFMYLHANRYNMPASQASGDVNGFAMRTQFTF